MADASIAVAEDQFTCAICLCLLKDPVTIPCGHNYCMGCFAGVQRCPQCREAFSPRPVLGRNTMLAEVVEKLKATGLCADVRGEELSEISRAGRLGGERGCLAKSEEPLGVGAAAAEAETCSLSAEPPQEEQRLMCSHAVSAACQQKTTESPGPRCTVCLTAPLPLGDQPDGQMTWYSGFDILRNKYFRIIYDIPSGMQTGVHPNPGKPFTGIRTSALLPITPEGEEVLYLLRKAFDQRLLFTVAATDGAADRAVFADIPHATYGLKCRRRGFLQRVKAALKAKGIE